MGKIYDAQTDNVILHRLFRKAELSYAVSDLSKAIGPIIDLMFISLFIGTAGVTVMGYVSPLIMLFELIGQTSAAVRETRYQIFSEQENWTRPVVHSQPL